jgi:GTP pyrophosphokinase
MEEEKQLTQEERDDQMINEAFEALLNDYIS